VGDFFRFQGSRPSFGRRLSFVFTPTHLPEDPQKFTTKWNG
jgi:hypothetical protein